jgi:hypothetical protein
MHLFISWSGEQSKAVAIELQQWLQEVIQAVQPWMSTDIEKGKKWIDELNGRLEQSRVGILCLTRSALNSPWLHYEAGALAKTKDALVCSLLFDVAPDEVKYPLAQFQQTLVEREDFRRLVHSINRAVSQNDGRSLPDAVLDRLFERNWDRLETALSAAMEIEESSEESAMEGFQREQPPEELEMIEEMMGVVLLARAKEGWSIEEFVPAVLKSISPNAQPPPPNMLAMMAGQFEKKNLAKLIRMGLIEKADEKYFLTDLGQRHFRGISERVKIFQRRISAPADERSEA